MCPFSCPSFQATERRWTTWQQTSMRAKHIWGHQNPLRWWGNPDRVQMQHWRRSNDNWSVASQVKDQSNRIMSTEKTEDWSWWPNWSLVNLVINIQLGCGCSCCPGCDTCLCQAGQRDPSCALRSPGSQQELFFFFYSWTGSWFCEQPQFHIESWCLSSEVSSSHATASLE